MPAHFLPTFPYTFIPSIVHRHVPRHAGFSLAARRFYVSQPYRIMELTGFSQEQLDVREAVGKICSKFPDEYWAEHDESGAYPHEFHAALANDGWIGIALSEDLGGSGLGHIRSNYDAADYFAKWGWYS